MAICYAKSSVFCSISAAIECGSEALPGDIILSLQHCSMQVTASSLPRILHTTQGERYPQVVGEVSSKYRFFAAQRLRRKEKTAFARHFTCYLGIAKKISIGARACICK